MPFSEGEFRSALEQAETGFEKVARILDSYYAALKEETSFPDDMIRELVYQFHAHWLAIAFPMPTPKDKQGDA